MNPISPAHRVQAITRLAHPDRSSIEERRDALRLLLTLPHEEHLLQGLSLAFADPQLLDEAIPETIDHLHALLARGDMLACDRLLQFLLDFCLGYHDPPLWEARTLLLRSLMGFVNQLPAAARVHHVSRLLAAHRSLTTTSAQGEDVRNFFGAVERSMDQLANSSTPSGSELLRLRRERQFRKYRDQATPVEELKGYLASDAGQPLEALNGEWFEVYRDFLVLHGDPALIQKGLENLARWLDIEEFDLNRADGPWREQADTLVLAGAGEPWLGSNNPVSLLLEANLVLLPGPGQESDLLHHLWLRYNHPIHAQLLAATLRVVSCLPEARQRLKGDLGELLQSLLKRGHQPVVWEAAIELVNRFLVGLPAVRPTSPVPDEQAVDLARLWQEAFELDAILRDWLLQVSRNARLQAPDYIRQRAWEVLLRSLPERRDEYFAEGLDDGALFKPTLDVARETMQRQLWRALAPRWPRLLAPDSQSGLREVDRHSRLVPLFDALAVLRPSELMISPDPATRSLVHVAVGDPSPEIREHAEQAVVAAGYGLYLDLVRGRERALELARRREVLASDNARRYREIEGLIADELEQQRELISARFQVESAETAQLGLRIQWQAFRARHELDLVAYQRELAPLLAQADEQSELLQQIQRQLENHHQWNVEARQKIEGAEREAEEIAQRLPKLHQEQVNSKAEQERLRADLAQRIAARRVTENELARAKVAHRQGVEARDKVAAVQRRAAERNADPALAAQGDQLRQELERLQAQIVVHQREVATAERITNELTRLVTGLEQQIGLEIAKSEKREQQYNETTNAVGRLTSQIAQTRAQLGAVGQESERLREGLSQGQATRDRTRAEIDRIRALITATTTTVSVEEGRMNQSLRAYESVINQGVESIRVASQKLEHLSHEQSRLRTELQRQQDERMAVEQELAALENRLVLDGWYAADQLRQVNWESADAQRNYEDAHTYRQELKHWYFEELQRALTHERQRRAEAPSSGARTVSPQRGRIST